MCVGAYRRHVNRLRRLHDILMVNIYIYQCVATFFDESDRHDTCEFDEKSMHTELSVCSAGQDANLENCDKGKAQNHPPVCQ